MKSGWSKTSRNCGWSYWRLTVLLKLVSDQMSSDIYAFYLLHGVQGEGQGLDGVWECVATFDFVDRVNQSLQLKKTLPAQSSPLPTLALSQALFIRNCSAPEVLLIWKRSCTGLVYLKQFKCIYWFVRYCLNTDVHVYVPIINCHEYANRNNSDWPGQREWHYAIHLGATLRFWVI